MPPASGLTQWFFGTATHSNDAGARNFNCILVQVGTQAAGNAFAVNDLPELLKNRRGLQEPLHTIVFASTDAALAARGVLAAAQIRSGVSVFEAPTPARKCALFSLAAAMVVPAATSDEAETDASAPTALLNDTDSLFFEACAAGVPIAEWVPTTPLPLDPQELLGHAHVPHHAKTTQAESLRIASQVARREALEATVDVASFRPDVWQEPVTPLGKPLTEPDRPQRIVIAGHDMKFTHAAVVALEAQGHEVRIDEWSGHARHDEAQSRELLKWADVVWCEWTLGNAAWYSRNIDNSTRLVTRLHLQELSTPFPSAVRWEKVDAAVVVAEHVRHQLLRDSNAPFERTVVIPNMVHVPDAPPHHDDDARFRLGLVGMVPARKGLREALDLLTALRSVDDRYTLSLRGKRPEEYPWMAQRGQESDYFSEQLARIETEPLLRGAVDFSPFGPDMAAWYATVGVVLSTSEFESFHFTGPDGAVHGALPMLLSWPGADLLYPASWLQPDVQSLATAILEATMDAPTWRARAAEAREFIAETYAEERVIRSLTSTILGKASAGSEPLER